MKKNYITPAVQCEKVQAATMMAGSIKLGDNGTVTIHIGGDDPLEDTEFDARNYNFWEEEW